MYTTKHDLNAEVAKMDYQALLETAEVALTLCLEKIQRYHDSIRDERGHYSVSQYHDAQYLHRNTKFLVTIAETLHLLKELPERPVRQFVNIPKRKESNDS